MRKYEMEIDSLRANISSARRVVILKRKDADCYVPIWIGTTEAEAIARKLHDYTSPRPATHDLLCAVVDKLGGDVVQALLTNVRDETVYALLVLEVDGELIEIDARPSDAIAIAVRTEAPIYACEELLETMGENFIGDDPEDESPRAKKDSISKADGGGKKARRKDVAFFPLGKEERRRLSAFSDFMASLESDGEKESPAN